MPILLIPFAVFFGCCLAQFFFIARVRSALAERHPDVLQELVGGSFFATNAIPKFAWRRADRGLNDPDLTERVKQYRLLMFLAFAAWGLFALSLFTGLGEQRLSFDVLLGSADAPSARETASSATVAPAHDVPRAFGAMFGAAFVCNAIYLGLTWALSRRWNALRLGSTATMADPLAVLGVIWWATPERHDDGFQRLRLVTRVVSVVALAGTLTLFAAFFSGFGLIRG